jgi:hypothetical protein
MSVSASTLVPVATTPTDPARTWSLAAFLACNWAAGVRVRTAWPVDISTSPGTGAEQRRCASNKPARTLTFTVDSDGARAAVHALHALRRAGYARSLVPLHSDAATLTGAASGATIPCVTAYRRFHAGARVAIVRPLVRGELVERRSFELGAISSVSADHLTLAASVTGSYPAGSRVYPLLECDVVPSGRGRANSGVATSTQFTLAEVPGPTALPASAAMGSPGLPTFGGHGIWMPPVNDAAQFGWDRVARSAGSGTARVWELTGDRPVATWGSSATCGSRAAWWGLLNVFDGSCGSLLPLVAVDPLSRFNVIGVAGATVTVEAVGPSEYWDAVPYFAARSSLTACTVYAISSVTRSGDGTLDTLTLSNTLGLTPPEILRATAAHLCRFATDYIEETWTSDECVTLPYSLVEVLQERSVVMV